MRIKEQLLSRKWRDEEGRIEIRTFEERHFGPKSAFYADLNRYLNSNCDLKLFFDQEKAPSAKRFRMQGTTVPRTPPLRGT